MSVTIQPTPNGSHRNAGVQQDIHWEDFRDHLATAEKDGKRKWVYAKKPSGKWYRRRAWFSVLLLAIMFIGPFVRINGNPLLMFNIVERRFSILGQIFWPQDVVIFAVAMLLFITSIIIFTTAFGRLWCGWACPQTVLMEMVFRRVEYWIEGDAAEQRALATAPWSRTKVAKKALKHATFFGLSFLIGNTLLSYIIGADALIDIVRDDPREHITGLSFMMLFTLIFYAIFARFREQACTFICPYGRFQSAVLDENTMVVAYDHKRGEKRGKLHRNQAWANRLAEGYGDCVNCRACVAVCPTGIDIRNGTQMECVSCTACIDACDSVMTKVGRPTGLIRYASLNSIEKGERFRFTARMGWYSAVLFALAMLLSALVFTRAEVETLFLRAPGALYQETADGKIQNLYTVKVINKTSHEIAVQMRVENFPAELQIMGHKHFSVAKEQLAQTSVLIRADKAAVQSAKTPLKIGVYSNDKLLETVETVFAGPRDR
ncbi:MAG TPA: cytochrome c oxidase accessory protein CcoG [Methylomirabilota bacterium]|nr:cytochrome c oxidase accessory protein CcoG [Methylomirabilota bacterium]